MSTGALPVPAVVAAPRRPRRAAGRLAVREVRRGALVVAAVCAGMSAFVAAQYQTTFKGSFDGPAMRALAENPAIRTLLGPPVALDDPGGFTVWRTGIPLLVLASVWTMLAAIRISRGEEDAGRWELLLGGRLRMVDLVVRCLAALAGSAALISGAVAVGLLAADTDATGAVVYAAGILGVTLTFAAAGLLAAQMMPSRAAATGLTVGLLGTALLLRMLADGVPQLAWSAWATPFGLTARTAPYADNRVGPLLVLATFPIVLSSAALVTAWRRDLGSGIVAVRTSRSKRTRLLRSIGGFAVRRTMRPTLGWATGITAYFLLVGAMIASILQFFEENHRFAEFAAAAGMAGLDSATGFAAAIFGLLAIPTGLYAATRLASFVADERDRLWTLLFAGPISRTRLVFTEIVVTICGVIALHVIAGLAMWLGARITGVPLHFADALAGALNAAPVALLALGAAAFAVGWLPSAVGAIGALPVVGGFLLNVITQSTRAPRWIADLSPWAHLAAVPATGPNWLAATAFALIAATLIALGVAGYSRRDLST